MADAIDTCLQCGQTRAQVKANETFCATLSGYETVEVDEEWDRHHWRDWSNAELAGARIPQAIWADFRRVNIADFALYHWDQAMKNCKHTGEIDNQGRCWFCCALVPTDTTEAKDHTDE